MGNLEFPSSNKEKSNNDVYMDRQLDDRLYEAIWSPTTWLH